MSSVTGSRLAFFAPNFPATAVNVVLTADGTSIGAPAANSFNIEVFTSTAGTLASGYDGSAFVQGAVQLSNNAVQAATIGSTEQLLAGSYTVIDQTGSEKIQVVGTSGTGGSSTTVVGSIGDTITGSSVAGDSQLIDASNTNASVTNKGPETIQGGAGATTVWGSAGDSITGGAGSLQVSGNLGTGITVVGGAGSLKAFDFGTKASVSGSTGGTTFIDTSYAGGGASSIVGGSGAGALAGGENTEIVAGKADRVTVGSALTYVDAAAGSVTVTGGTGTGTGTIEASAFSINSNILGGVGDNITGGAGATYIDASAGSQTIGGGAGKTTVFGGKSDVITGLGGNLQVNDLSPSVGGGEKITGGSGNLFVFNVGKSVTVTGSTLGTTFVDDSYSVGGAAVGGKSKITGGSGTATGTLEGFTANTGIVGAAGDTVIGLSGSMVVDGRAGSMSVTAGAGATTVIGGANDSISGGTGTLRVDIATGSEQITVGSGAATLRDVSNPTGTPAVTTVTGFNATLDTIASKTSVDPSNTYIGSSKSDGAGGTILSFNDGSTMTLVGVGNGSTAGLKFTQ